MIPIRNGKKLGMIDIHDRRFLLNKSNDILLALFMILLISIVLILGRWGHDTTCHLFRIFDTSELFEHGELAGYLSPNALNGKGLPIYAYYSQWIYFLPFLLTKLNISILLAYKLSYVFFIILTAFSFYLLMALYVKHDLATLGTIMYLSSNYFLFDIYVRSAYAEFASCAMLPLLLYAFAKVLVRKELAFSLLAVFSATFMILFHPLSFLNSAIAIIFFILFAYANANTDKFSLLKPFLLVLCSLALTSFFWLPAFIEKRYVLGKDAFRFSFRDTFFDFINFLEPSSGLGPGFFLSVFFIFSILFSIYLIQSKKGKYPFNILLITISAFIYLFLLSDLSLFIWDDFKFLQSNIFVWRLLFPLSVMIVLCVTLHFSLLPNQYLRKIPLWVIAFLLITHAGFFLYNNRHKMALFNKSERSTIDRTIHDYRNKQKGSGISEYLPRIEQINNSGYNYKCIVNLKDDKYKKDNDNLTIRIPQDIGDCAVRVPFIWNTRYKAFSNGTQLPLTTDKNGEILLMPKHHTTVYIKLTTPPYVKMSNIFSAIIFFFLLVLTIRGICIFFIKSRSVSNSASHMSRGDLEKGAIR